jgi:hypothetical protein
MSRFHFGTRVCWIVLLVLSLGLAVSVAAQEPALPYVEIETFPVPASAAITPATLGSLSTKTGIAGTEIVGIRLKIGLVDDHSLETLDLAVADGLFLVESRGFFSAAGHLLARIVRFLLLGQLVSAGSGLEIPAQSWSMLFGGASAEASEMMDLYTRRELSVRGGDASITHHGDFIVCRFLIAANQLTELVDVRIKTRHRRTQDWLSYRIPRLVLPIPREGISAASENKDLVRLGTEDYVGTSSAFGGSEELILAGYLRSIEGRWMRASD